MHSHCVVLDLYFVLGDTQSLIVVLLFVRNESLIAGHVSPSFKPTRAFSRFVSWANVSYVHNDVSFTEPRLVRTSHPLLLSDSFLRLLLFRTNYTSVPHETSHTPKPPRKIQIIPIIHRHTNTLLITALPHLMIPQRR